MNITLLDGGNGQEIYLRSNKPAHPLWSVKVMLDNPNIVTKVHEDFIKSGSKIICLNTYTATYSRLKRDGKVEWFKKAHEIAISCAKKSIDRNRLKFPNIQISGCLPPLVASYKPETTRSYEECLDEYSKIVEIQEQNVDFFLAETMSTILEAKSAIDATKYFNKKLLVSFTLDDNKVGFLRSGESLKDAILEIQNCDIEGILLNCSSVETIDNCIDFFKYSNKRFGAYANGFTTIKGLNPGGTVDVLSARKDLIPSKYSKYILNWIKKGATIIGGCCEIGPNHIKQIYTDLKFKKYNITNLNLD